MLTTARFKLLLPWFVRWVCFIVALLIAQTTCSEPLAQSSSVLLSSLRQSYDLSLDLRYFEDPEAKFAFDQIKGVWNQIASSEQPQQAHNFGFSDSAYWFHVRLKNQDSPESEWILETLYPIIDYVDLYLVYDDGRLIEQQSGDSVKFKGRSKSHHNVNFSFTLPPGKSVDIFLRAKTSGSIQMPVMVWTEDAFSARDHNSQLVFGLYYGLILSMAVYNLLIFFASRDINYFWYVTYIISYGLMQLSVNGLSFEYIWPESPWWNNRSVAFFLWSGLFFVLAFSRSFLALKITSPRFDLLFKTLQTGFVLACVLSLLVPYGIAIRSATVATMITISLITVSGVYCWSKHFKPARYFVISLAAPFVSMFCYILKTYGVLPTNFYTEYAIQIGSAFEVVLLSLALADRIRILTQENQRMQLAETVELEARVRERTKELENANQQLEELNATDGLTSVHNRRYFDNFMLSECKRISRGGELSVLMIDVDKFKNFNDVYGHQAGDDCLINVAAAIKSCLRRESDKVARYGGEEFSVILPATNIDGAMLMAEKIRKKVNNLQLSFGGKVVQISVSIGVTTANGKAQTEPAKVVASADKALYQSKENGRNQCTYLPMLIP